MPQVLREPHRVNISTIYQGWKLAIGPVLSGRPRIAWKMCFACWTPVSGSYAEVRSARSGLLRVCAYAPGASGGLDISGLRMLLIADLLARTAELRDWQVLTVLAFAGPPSGQVTAFEQAADALGIHPPVARASSDDAPAALGGPIDVHLVSDGASPEGGQNGLVTRVGAAHMGSAVSHDEAAKDLLARSRPNPLGIRLALMSVAYDQPADLTEDLLASAGETVAHWRRQLAEWAELPSRPMPTRIAETAQAAFDDLDTRRALTLLRDLALDACVPTGAKFETFLYADRILGLELAREIGQPRD